MYCLEVLAERKSLSDLVGSIQDGRYGVGCNVAFHGLLNLVQVQAAEADDAKVRLAPSVLCGGG